MVNAAPPEHRVAPRGELCVDTLDELRTALRTAGQASGNVVVDLAEVTILSAAAIALLVRVDGVQFVNPSPLSRSVLTAVGLEHLVRD
jgi:anti-anti-sigma regulatory factor